MAEQRALWVSTASRGGISSYVRTMRRTPLWGEWRIRHIATHRDGSTIWKILVFAAGALRFAVELICFRPDVIHLHSGSRGSFARKAILFWISRPSRVPVVFHMHGSGFQEDYESSPPLVRAVIRTTLCHVSAFVTLGELWAERMRDIVPNARIVAVPNGVNPARRVPQTTGDKPVHVVFLGRIGDHKGTFTLLDAWAKLACEPWFNTANGSIATLTVAGDGEVDRARRRVRELCIGGTVEIRDWLSEAAVGQLLDCAQVLVLPSRNEGQPMAVLEAMARGLCVITTGVGGLPEMIGEGCGVLIAPDDSEAIATALARVIVAPELRAEYGCAAYKRIVEHFDTRVVGRRLDALYREVRS
ncbi:glycosyltransferase family 4 protein [Mycobacterium sp. AMU20-3851]|uniref:glycosyltransferase family 4 protein n=1 Tax=Mycobacterium sp. AMU20-3851 TaxID=3122055 RepID=UPI003754102C